MDSRFRGNDSSRESVEGEGQPRLVGRRGVAMQDTIVDRVIDESQRWLQKLFRSGFVLGSERGAEFPDLMPQLCGVRAVQFGTLLGLLDAL